MPHQRNITPEHIGEVETENNGLFSQQDIFSPYFFFDAGRAQLGWYSETLSLSHPVGFAISSCHSPHYSIN